MVTAIHVTALTHADIEPAISCIQAAFANDPYFSWVFNSQHFNPSRNRASLRARCLWGMKHALFHVAKDETGTILGISCWLPPALAAPSGLPPSWADYLLSLTSFTAWSAWLAAQRAVWELWLSQLTTNIQFRGRGGLNLRRYWIWKAAQASAQQALWTDPKGYYFCNIVTVMPAAQGKGVGKRLMEVVLRQADQEGRKCYLESSRDVPNVRIYERMGFELRREMLCKEEEGDEGIMLYCMIREPQAPH